MRSSLFFRLTKATAGFLVALALVARYCECTPVSITTRPITPPYSNVTKHVYRHASCDCTARALTTISLGLTAWIGQAKPSACCRRDHDEAEGGDTLEQLFVLLDDWICCSEAVSE